jgi:hypothetical protein
MEGKTMQEKYAVKNTYGIGLEAERNDDSGYAYIPRARGQEGYNRCDKWCRRNDRANTCTIVVIED